MKTPKNEFRKMLQEADPGYRHCLRKAADLMEWHGFNPRELLGLGPTKIESLLTRRNVKNAAGLARRVPGALNHLAERFPDAGLPVIPVGPAARHALPRRRDEPRLFRIGIVTAWRANRCRHAEDPASTCSPLSFQTYLRSARVALAACRRAEIAIDDEFGLEDLTYADVVLATLDQLRGEYSPKTVLTILNGVIAVARHVLVPDHPHLAFLEAQRGSRALQPSRELSHVAELRLAEIMCSGGVQKLLAVPDSIEESALAPNCGRKDRVARMQYAFLLGLKFDHPGLTEKQAVRLNLATDIQVRNGKHFLVLWPTAKEGMPTWEPITEHSMERLTRLWTTKKNANLLSTLLFPTREENFRAVDDERDGRKLRTPQFRGTGPVLATLYREIKLVSGLDVTFMGIKDLIVRVLLEAGVPPFIVARRAGYLNVRSLHLRMAAVFRTIGAP
jgi:hypothetical protein